MSHKGAHRGGAGSRRPHDGTDVPDAAGIPTCSATGQSSTSGFDFGDSGEPWSAASRAGGSAAGDQRGLKTFALYFPSRSACSVVRLCIDRRSWTGSAARHVDQQGRSGDGVTAAAASASSRRGASSGRKRRYVSTGQFPDAGGGKTRKFRVVPIKPPHQHATRGLRDQLPRRHGAVAGGHTLVLELHRLHRHDIDRRGGSFHSDRMRVVQGQREGDAIFYDLTLEDPGGIGGAARCSRHESCGGRRAGSVVHLGTWQLRHKFRRGGARVPRGHTPAARTTSGVRPKPIALFELRLCGSRESRHHQDRLGPDRRSGRHSR